MAVFKVSLKPTQSTPCGIRSLKLESSPPTVDASANESSACQIPSIVPKNPKSRANKPISFTQRGAFQAAKKMATKSTESTDMNPRPPSTKKTNIRQNGFGVKLSVTKVNESLFPPKPKPRTGMLKPQNPNFVSME